MVHVEEQRVLGIGEPGEPRPQQGAAGEVERLDRVLLGEPPRRAPGVGASPEVDERERHARGLLDPLDRLPVDLRERGAQRFVPAHDLVEGRAERGDVEPTAEPQRAGHVVPDPRPQPVEEPQPLLRERKW